MIVISQNDHTQKKASMLQDMHYRNISQRLVLLRRTEEAAKYLEATKLQTSNGYSEEFTVMEDLMGLAIGEIKTRFVYTNVKHQALVRNLLRFLPSADLFLSLTRS